MSTFHTLSSLARTAGWLGIVLIAGCPSQTSNPPAGGGTDTTLASAATGAAENSAIFNQLAATPGIDPVQTLLSRLQRDPNVTAAALSPDGATIVVTLANGTRYGIITDQADRPEWQEVPPLILKQNVQIAQALGAADAAITCEPTTFPQSSRAVVVLQFAEGLQQKGALITTPLKRAAYTVDTIRITTQAELTRFKTLLQNCGVLYFSTHGSIQPAQDGHLGNSLSTEIEADPNNIAATADPLFVEYGNDFLRFFTLVGLNGKAYWALMPEFFATFTYPNSMIYADACHSGEEVFGGTELSVVFRDHGAGAFLGWTGTVPIKLSNPVAEGIFKGLTPSQAEVQSVTLTITPPHPGASESYTPSAHVDPPAPDIEVHLSITGTDGFSRSETQITDAGGNVTFSIVPGGASAVQDTVTAVAGGANNAATVLSVLQASPELQKIYDLPWNPVEVTVQDVLSIADPSFNLICNNSKAVQQATFVKF